MPGELNEWIVLKYSSGSNKRKWFIFSLFNYKKENIPKNRFLGPDFQALNNLWSTLLAFARCVDWLFTVLVLSLPYLKMKLLWKKILSSDLLLLSKSKTDKINDVGILSTSSENKSESEPAPLKATYGTVFVQGSLPGKVGNCN